MLKEIKLSEIPERKDFGREITPDGAFAEKTLLDFIDSDIMIAEIEGWPSGDPTSSKQANRYANMLKQKVNKHKRGDVDVLMRGRRIFIQKTVIRNMAGGRHD